MLFLFHRRLDSGKGTCKDDVVIGISGYFKEETRKSASDFRGFVDVLEVFDGEKSDSSGFLRGLHFLGGKSQII